MKNIKLMVNGLPGDMAKEILNAAIENHIDFVPFSLTGPETSEANYIIKNKEIKLIKPNDKDKIIDNIKNDYGTFITIDYTHPSAVVENAKFYCKNNLPFVMGTTGGNRDLLSNIVQESSISAVIAPNMAKQIVGFQAMFDYAAKNFPDLFKDFDLKIVESHQKTKADTSGTAKLMVKYFNKLGLNFKENEIQKVRDPEIQKNELKVPKAYIDGHGFHTYELVSKDGTASFSFSHNICGRKIYVGGTLDAALFLDKKKKENVKGKVYSMIDVLM